MAKKNLPNWAQRQRLLYSKQHRGSAEELGKWGRESLKAHRHNDALDYFLVAQDQEGLKTMEDFAMESGDTFLLAALDKAGGADVTEKDWDQVGSRALELGKLQFALAAFEKADNPRMLAQVKEAIGVDGESSPAE